MNTRNMAAAKTPREVMLKRIRTLRAAGRTWSEVAETLNAEGVPSPDGRWSPESVRHLLAVRALVGIVGSIILISAAITALVAWLFLPWWLNIIVDIAAAVLVSWPWKRRAAVVRRKRIG